jgi:hypothetical protein
VEIYLHSLIRFHDVHSEKFTVFFAVFSSTRQKIAKSLELKDMSIINGVCL